MCNTLQLLTEADVTPATESTGSELKSISGIFPSHEESTVLLFTKLGVNCTKNGELTSTDGYKNTHIALKVVSNNQ